jgi:hypothetical protein
VALILKLLGGLLMTAGALAALVLPGADANASFEWWGWLYIVGLIAVGWLLFFAGTRSR